MGNTQGFGYAPWQHHGPAKIIVWDPVRSTWSAFGLIENPRFQVQVGMKSKFRKIEGRRVPVESRQSGDETATLSFRWIESLDPRGNQLVYGDKTNSQTINAIGLAAINYEDIMYRNDQEGVYLENYPPYDAAQANYSTLPAPATFVATVSAGGTGSAWATAGNPDYYAWAQFLHVDPASVVVPTIGTIADFALLDVEWCLGAPFDNAAGTAGYNGVPINFTNATDEVKFTGTAATEGPTPAYVAIYMATTDNLAVATCVQIITYATFIGAGTLLLTLPVGDTYVASNHASFYFDTGTHAVPSWVQKTVGTDITWDNTRAAYKLKAGTFNGKQIRGKFFYVFQPGFTQRLGPSGTSQDNRKFAIVCLEPQVDGSSPLYAEGDIATIYRANTANLPVDLTWPDDDWEAGMEVSIPCLADPSNNYDYGSRRVISKALRSYDIQLNY